MSPPQGRDRDASELHFQVGHTAYLTAAQPEESNGIRTEHNVTVQTGACPEDGDDAFTWNLSRLGIPFGIPSPFITPQINKPHLASIAGSAPAVAKSPLEDVAQVVRNWSGPSGDNSQARDTERYSGWDYIKNGFPVVKLI